VGLIDNIKEYQHNFAVNSKKEKAYLSFLEQGFPNTKNEEWKFSSLKKIISNDFSIEDKGIEINTEEINHNSLNFNYKIIFINGVLDSKPIIKGVKINKHVDESPSFSNAFSALNAAFSNTGYEINVDPNIIIEEPIEILFLTKNSSNNFIQYRNKIVLGENSQIKIIESVKNIGDQYCFTNMQTNIKLNRSSNIEFNKLQNNNDSQITIDETSLTQEENSNSTVNTLLFGGMFTRNNLNFAQNGEHCESNMNGVVILDDNEFGDNHTYMDHKNANCESNELYKGIYLGKSRGVFNGKIMVQPDAQKINAFQANNNLLVSDNASINSKPQLEIYADDVKCSHGCTIGQLDENALFYMNTRGIRKEDARAILTFAFASEALEKISINKIEDLAKDLIAQKLKVDLSF
jgi:Fe-S cluster assembly protein SufD